MNPTFNPNFNLQTQGFQAPKVPTMMDASTLQNQTKLNLTPASTPIPPPSITNLPTDTITTPTQTTPVAPTQDPTSSAWKSAFDKVTGLFSQKGNQASDLATSTENATAPYTQQLNEINSQIKMQQANALERQQKIMNSGTTSSFASAEARNQENSDNIETLKLSAIAEGLRGNIALAQTHTTNAINAKYAEFDKQLEEAKTNIYDNYESFTPAEKKRADATLLRLDKEDAFVKERKAEDKSISDIAIKLAEKGGDNITIQKVMDANSLEEAIAIAGSKLQSGSEKIIGSASTGYFKVNADGSTTPIKTSDTPSGNNNPPTVVPTKEADTLKKALNESKFSGEEADGKYADPNLYLQNYQTWVNPPNNGSPEVFFKAFPPATYINPENTTLPPEIMKFVSKPKTKTGMSNPFE